MTLDRRKDGPPQGRPLKLDGLTDEPAPRGLSALATWAGIALMSMALAVMAARSEFGSQRLSQLVQPAQQPAARRPEPPPAADPLLVYETRRLADQVRVLAAEREQMMERLAVLERTLGDVTASIPRAAEPPVRPAPRAAEAPQDAATAPAPAPGPQPAADPSPAPAAQESTVIRTEFGVDLAGETSVEALRARWQGLRARHAALLEGLRPVVAVQENPARQGGVELRLVAGPLSNANAAARLCAALGSAAASCKPAVFDGQRLTLR